MNNYIVKNQKTEKDIQYYICERENFSIFAEPSKYLKHKLKEHCSPNTIRRIAYALTHYLTYLDVTGLNVKAVLAMKYAEQHEHFVNFLLWVKDGNHNKTKQMPTNNTANSYLQAVFGYYDFLIVQYELQEELKVFNNTNISFGTSTGIRFKRSIKQFKGYLQKEDSIGKTIKEEEIKRLLDASDSIRNKLLILLLVETGFRIGELLGIRWSKDIDFENRTIKVMYREDNENLARAKNAEYRRAKISKETYEILEYYISENRNLLCKTEYLFINLYGERKGAPMTVDGVYSALKILQNKTGIEVTPHMLRHYFANERRKNGWSIDKISKALGHRQLATTERYLHIEDEELSTAMNAYYDATNALYNVDKLI